MEESEKYKGNEIPPNDPSSERGLLGAILESPDEVLRECAEVGVTEKWFYTNAHREVWRAFCAMQREGLRIDPLCLMAFLRAEGGLEGVGGAAFLATLLDGGGSGLAGEYLHYVRRFWALRRLLQITDGVSGRVYGRLADPAGIGTGLESEAAELNETLCAGAGGGRGPADRDWQVDQTIADMTRRYDLHQAGKISGIPTGFPDLDRLTQGWQFGEMAVVAARPNTGKSALAAKCVHHAVFNLEIPTALVNLEGSSDSFHRRLACIHMSANASNLKSGALTPEDLRAFTQTVNRLRTLPLFFIDGTSGLTLDQIKHMARGLIRRHGIKFLVVDYLQKIKPSEKAEKRTYEVGSISTALKGFLVQTGLAGLALAQLSRAPEQDKGRRPRMSDLADSAQIERDADLIGFIHRERTDGDPDGLKTKSDDRQAAGRRDGGRLTFIFKPNMCGLRAPAWARIIKNYDIQDQAGAWSPAGEQ
jgi:replicative DNA helicase